MNRILKLLFLISSLALAETPLDHLLGTWQVDTDEVKAHIRCIDQEGVYTIPDNLIPTNFIVEKKAERDVSVTMETVSGGTRTMQVLMATPNELIFTYDFVGNENAPQTNAEKPYSFPELFRCAYRTRALQCIVFTDKIQYRCLAYKK